MKPIRLDKYLSEMSVESRSGCKTLVRQGQIRINHEKARKAEQKLLPGQDRVFVDEQEIPYYEKEYFLLHKPAGYITATEDAGQKTVMELLPPVRRQDLFPVGRLDKDTEGLLLITNDGALSHRLLSPRHHVEKVYFAEIEGKVTDEDVEAFRNGLFIGDDKPTLPAILTILESDETSRVEITITEGRYHQVKRMFEARGKKVTYLKRLRMGKLVLPEDLSRGSYMRLNENLEFV